MPDTERHQGETRILTFAEVCDRLRISPKTCRKIIQSGALNASRVGGNRAYRVSEDAVDTYLREQAVQAAS